MRRRGDVSGRVRELKDVLDRLLDAVEVDDDLTVDGRAVLAEALANFRAAPADLLADATPFLRQYHRSVADEFGPGRSYLSFEGEVSWEPEHGLQLVVEHGLRVCKVGPYDGHHTVAHALGDESLLGVVFG